VKPELKRNADLQEQSIETMRTHR